MASGDDDHWIEKATAKNKGKLRKETHAANGKDISAKRLHAAAHSKNATIRKEANLAATLKNLHK